MSPGLDPTLGLGMDCVFTISRLVRLYDHVVKTDWHSVVRWSGPSLAQFQSRIPEGKAIAMSGDPHDSQARCNAFLSFKTQFPSFTLELPISSGFLLKSIFKWFVFVWRACCMRVMEAASIMSTTRGEEYPAIITLNLELRGVRVVPLGQV